MVYWMVHLTLDQVWVQAWLVSMCCVLGTDTYIPVQRLHLDGPLGLNIDFTLIWMLVIVGFLDKSWTHSWTKRKKKPTHFTFRNFHFYSSFLLNNHSWNCYIHILLSNYKNLCGFGQTLEQTLFCCVFLRCK